MTVKQIFRYPVKGLSATPLDRTDLVAFHGLPHDRRFAISRGELALDPDAPKWFPKSNFIMLMHDEKLAQLTCEFDPGTGKMTLLRGGKQVVSGDATTSLGRNLIDQFFGAFLGRMTGGRARLLDGATMGEKRDGLGVHRFFDHDYSGVSIIALESLRHLERVAGKTLDPLRFRANFYVEGLPAWCEFDWVGQEITLGGVRLKVVKRIQRCAATNVDLASATRDMNVPLTLKKGFGHMDLGIHAVVLEDGAVAVGDGLEPPAASSKGTK